MISTSRTAVIDERPCTPWYEWLGVAQEPRLRDLAKLIATLTAQPPTPGARATVRDVFEHLGERLHDRDVLPNELATLATRSWLPAQGDDGSWWAPKALAASFNQELFSSQARFLDIDHDAQGRCAKFINLRDSRHRHSYH